MNKISIFFDEIDKVKALLKGLTMKWPEDNEGLIHETELITSHSQELKFPLKIVNKYYKAEIYFSLTLFPSSDQEKDTIFKESTASNFTIYYSHTMNADKNKLIHEIDSKLGQSESKLIITKNPEEFTHNDDFIEIIQDSWALNTGESIMKNEDFQRFVEIIECTSWMHLKGDSKGKQNLKESENVIPKFIQNEEEEINDLNNLLSQMLHLKSMFFLNNSGEAISLILKGRPRRGI